MNCDECTETCSGWARLISLTWKLTTHWTDTANVRSTRWMSRFQLRRKIGVCRYQNYLSQYVRVWMSASPWQWLMIKCVIYVCVCVLVPCFSSHTVRNDNNDCWIYEQRKYFGLSLCLTRLDKPLINHAWSVCTWSFFGEIFLKYFRSCCLFFVTQ